jgi:hypothetical protein
MKRNQRKQNEISDRTVVFSGSSGFPTNKTDRHDITELLLKVALNTIKQTRNKTYGMQINVYV